MNTPGQSRLRIGAAEIVTVAVATGLLAAWRIVLPAVDKLWVMAALAGVAFIGWRTARALGKRRLPVVGDEATLAAVGLGPEVAPHVLKARDIVARQLDLPPNRLNPRATLAEAATHYSWFGSHSIAIGDMLADLVEVHGCPSESVSRIVNDTEVPEVIRMLALVLAKQGQERRS